VPEVWISVLSTSPQVHRSTMIPRKYLVVYTYSHREKNGFTVGNVIVTFSPGSLTEEAIRKIEKETKDVLLQKGSIVTVDALVVTNMILLEG
jgi:hypothetical protein